MNPEAMTSFEVKLPDAMLRSVEVEAGTELAERLEAGEGTRVVAVVPLSSLELEQGITSKPVAYFLALSADGTGEAVTATVDGNATPDIAIEIEAESPRRVRRRPIRPDQDQRVACQVFLPRRTRIMRPCSRSSGPSRRSRADALSTFAPLIEIEPLERNSRASLGSGQRRLGQQIEQEHPLTLEIGRTMVGSRHIDEHLVQQPLVEPRHVTAEECTGRGPWPAPAHPRRASAGSSRRPPHSGRDAAGATRRDGLRGPRSPRGRGTNHRRYLPTSASEVLSQNWWKA